MIGIREPFGTTVRLWGYMTEENKTETSTKKDPLDRPEVQWGVGCLLGATALVGLVIIALLIAIAVQPPDWVQVVTGIGLVLGGAALSWLIAAALKSSRQR